MLHRPLVVAVVASAELRFLGEAFKIDGDRPVFFRASAVSATAELSPAAALAVSNSVNGARSARGLYFASESAKGASG
jgi:hypothetical protein